MKKNLILLTALLLSFSAHCQNKFSAELLWKLGRVSEMELSPDGNSIIYGVSWYDVQENKGNRDIYRLDIDAESPRKLTEFKGNEINAVWRPDGLKIGFLSSESGSMQIWEMGPNGEIKNR